MASVLLCAGPLDPGDAGCLASALREAGHQVRVCTDPGDVIESLMGRRTDALLYALRAGSRSDLVTLRIARRVQPDALLLVIASESSLDTRAAIQPLRPTWYSVAPVDAAELCDVIRVASQRRLASRTAP